MYVGTNVSKENKQYGRLFFKINVMCTYTSPVCFYLRKLGQKMWKKASREVLIYDLQFEPLAFLVFHINIFLTREQWTDEDDTADACHKGDTLQNTVRRGQDFDQLVLKVHSLAVAERCHALPMVVDAGVAITIAKIMKLYEFKLNLEH